MTERVMNRRQFVQTAATVSAGFFALRQAFHASPAFAQLHMRVDGYGPLVPDPAGIFDLPEGFSYNIISRLGERMDDGLLVPGAHDGMAAFPGPDGKTIIIRNHELTHQTPNLGAFGLKHELLEGIPAAKLFDYGRGSQPPLGGTTTLVYDTRARKLERHFLSLAGTGRNCAGGPTPWNSWITCEEWVERAGDKLEKDHGYNFEVPASAEIGLVDPVPLRDMGRFHHEAVAVHEPTGIVYETEDRDDGQIYRFIPHTPGKLALGGRLQALAIIDKPSCDTRNWNKEGPTIKPGESMAVRWIDLDDPDSPKDDLRYRGFEAGAARFARGEGMWYGNDAIYFACTTGGVKKNGQIWRYVPSPNEGQPGETANPGKLELFIEPNDNKLMQNADNLTIAPWGDVMVCEDRSGDARIVGVTPRGELYHFGRNRLSKSELAGICFSPDGSTLFVNIQHDGITLAIHGPFQK